MDYRATLILYAELLFALGLLRHEGLLDTRARRAAALVMVSLAFVMRYACLTYETLDYRDWLHVWLGSLRETGPWRGLGAPIWSCNYNVPYLYILAVISVSHVPELLLIKLTSILFDVFMAFFVMKLVGVFTQSKTRRLIAFVGVLWLPTVFLNGALWGQCDVIYAAFAVAGVYFALSGRPGWSVAAIALSVSFKLQGIFLLPVYAVFLVTGRIRLRHLPIFPAVYIATLLPAVIAGRDFWELLTLYYNNTSTIGTGLNYNSSSMYALFDFSAMPNHAASVIGVCLAFFLCAFVFVWFFLRRREADERALLGAALLFCIGVPFFLPHMHDRYFFMADVLTFALAVILPAMSVPAALVSFGSFLGYHAYLKMRFLVPMSRGGLAMLIALVYTAVYTWLAFPGARYVPPPEEADGELTTE